MVAKYAASDEIGPEPVASVEIDVPTDVLADIDVMAGPGNRDTFITSIIREHVDRERLRRQRLVEVYDRFAGSLKDVYVPGWETPEDTVAWVSAMRTPPDDKWLAHYMTHHDDGWTELIELDHDEPEPVNGV